LGGEKVTLPEGLWQNIIPEMGILTVKGAENDVSLAQAND
jgi:hypothetical protein